MKWLSIFGSVALARFCHRRHWQADSTRDEFNTDEAVKAVMLLVDNAYMTGQTSALSEAPHPARAGRGRRESTAHHIVAAARTGQARSYSAPPTLFSLISARIWPGVGSVFGSTRLSGFQRSARTMARAHWK
jgi:hypothetical protein